MKKKTLLIVDDDAVFNSLLRRQIESMGFATVGAGSWAEAQQRLSEVEPNAIILDYKLPDSDAAHILGELRNQYPVIVLTGYGSIPNAVSAIREGAADFLTKPVNLDELELTVRRVLETAELRDSNRFYRTQLASHRPGPMVFESHGMRNVQEMIDAVGPTDTTVLILGESGTGKEMVAQAILERGDAQGVGLCVGASLEFLTGRVSRAPGWMQRARLEWLHRLASEPGRLGRRYLIEGPKILRIWLRWRNAQR